MCNNMEVKNPRILLWVCNLEQFITPLAFQFNYLDKKALNKAISKNSSDLKNVINLCFPLSWSPQISRTELYKQENHT